MKKFIALIVTVFTVAGAFSVPATQISAGAETTTIIREEVEKAWDGTADTSWFGEKQQVFEISDAKQLAGLAELVNKGYSFEGKEVKLTDDIIINTEMPVEEAGLMDGLSSLSYKMSETEWKPIGNEDNAFSGTFNGNCHKVKGLYVKSGKYAGLFATMKNATVKNLILSEGKITGDYCMGGICAHAKETDFTNCTSNVQLENKNAESQIYAGGIAGFADYCNFNNCVFDTSHNNSLSLNVIKSKTGDIYAGGIAGNSQYGTFKVCENYSLLMGNTQNEGNVYAGGICGAGAYSIEQCRNNSGAIARADEGRAYSGGIIGLAECFGDRSIIRQCVGASGYSNSSKKSYIGGVSGYGGTITDCYTVYGSQSTKNTEYSIGGISGENAIIKNCYCIGGVTIREDGDEESADVPTHLRSGILGRTGENGSVENSFFFSNFADCAVGDKPDDKTGSLDEKEITDPSFAEKLGDEYFRCENNQDDLLPHLTVCDAETMGDINGDGKINAFDLSALRNGYCNGFKTLAGRSAGDVNEDGIINEDDLKALSDFIIGKKNYLKKPTGNSSGSYIKTTITEIN